MRNNTMATTWREKQAQLVEEQIATQQEAWDIAHGVLWETEETTTRAEKMEAAKVIALFSLTDWLPKS